MDMSGGPRRGSDSHDLMYLSGKAIHRFSTPRQGLSNKFRVRHLGDSADILYSELLRTLASDEEVMKTEIWINRKPGKETTPTRRMRYEFVVGDRLAEFDTLVQFDKSFHNANKFTHTFSDDPEVVRVSIDQIEVCLYLLLRFSKRIQ